VSRVTHSSNASRSEAAEAERLCQVLADAMFCPIRADVAQLVEQRFRNLTLAPRELFAPKHTHEHERPIKAIRDADTVNTVATTLDPPTLPPRFDPYGCRVTRPETKPPRHKIDLKVLSRLG
jgi:hypothetical protein